MNVQRAVWMAILATVSAIAQTAVTATVTDPNGVPYAYGSVQITLSQAENSNGVSYTPPNATLNQYGFFGVSLPGNSQLQPQGSTYSFQICSSTTGLVPPFSATATCFVVSGVTISGASQNLTYVLSNAAVPLSAAVHTWTCQSGLGDGLNAIPVGTYLQSTCYNSTGVTVTLTSIKCFTDNTGSSTLNATNSASTALLTGAISCSSTFTAGAQSATTTIAAGDYIKFTFASDGSSKQTTWVVAGTF